MSRIYKLNKYETKQVTGGQHYCGSDSHYDYNHERCRDSVGLFTVLGGYMDSLIDFALDYTVYDPKNVIVSLSSMAIGVAMMSFYHKSKISNTYLPSAPPLPS